MIFTAALDDTSMASLRKSIFIYASFIAIVATYGATVDLSGKWFGVVDFRHPGVVGSVLVVTLSCLVQFYLLVRLITAKKIAYAKLQRSYGQDELDRDSRLKKLVVDLEGMVSAAKTVAPSDHIMQESTELLERLPSLQDVVADALIKIDQTFGEVEKLRVAFEATTASLNRVEPKFRQATDFVTKKYGDDSPEVQELLSLTLGPEHQSTDTGKYSVTTVAPSLGVELNDVIRTAREEISQANIESDMMAFKNFRENAVKFLKSNNDSVESLNKITQHLDHIHSFQPNFDSSALAKAVKDLSSTLVSVKEHREREFIFFEYGTPLAAGSLSILYGAWHIAVYLFGTFSPNGVDELVDVLTLV